MADKNWLQRAASFIGERLSAIPGEISQTFWDKSGPQGSSELAQALNSHSNAFVPYGHAQQPLEVEGPAMDYQSRLNQHIAQNPPQQEPDQGMER